MNDKELSKIDQDMIDRLVKDFPYFSEFEYLGVKMKVLAHRRYFWGMYSFSVIPVLACEYVDKNGVIRGKEFSFEQAMKIKGDL